MNRRVRILSLRNAITVSGIAILALFAVGASKSADPAPEWAMNGTIIEACSCPMFCQCYFNPEPAAQGKGEAMGHGEHAAHGEDEGHFCRFNNAFHVNEGHYGETDLTGAEFWVAGDLGSEFDDGKMDWAVLTFDPSVTESQRQGIMAILGKLYPVEWSSFEVAEDAKIDWKAGKDRSVAKLDGGKAAEVVLARFQGMSDDPVVVRNLRYWGAPRNDGFVLMPNEVEAYRLGDRAFEYGGGNGFMITFDINSSDVK